VRINGVICLFPIRVYPCQSAVRFCLSDHARCPDQRITRSPHPPPGYFGTFVANKGASANRPLHRAWVALAWPLGDPRVTQSQTQSQSGRGS